MGISKGEFSLGIPTPETGQLHSLVDDTFRGETAFRRAINLERKRAERCGNPALLLLLAFRTPARTNGNTPVVAGKLKSALLLALRETDFAGWFSDSKVLGAVFTELPPTRELQESVAAIIARVKDALQAVLRENNIQVAISSELYSRREPLPPRSSLSNSLTKTN